MVQTLILILAYYLYTTIGFFFKIILISIETKNDEILNDWRLKLLIKNIFFLQFLLFLISAKLLALLPLFVIVNATLLVAHSYKDEITNVWDEVHVHFKNQKLYSKRLAIIISFVFFIQTVFGGLV